MLFLNENNNNKIIYILMITTLNTIVKSIEDFTTRHKQLNSFFSGDNWDFQAKTNLYPALVCVTNPASISQGRVTCTFNIFISDICNKDRSNIDEIHSDTLQIFQDFFAEFRENEDFYGFTLLDENLVVDPFEEEFDDVLAGWNSVMTFEFMFSASNCLLPL